MSKGSLDARLSAMILHITNTNTFDRRDMVQLLKDVIAERNDLHSRLDEISAGLDRLRESPLLRKQAE